MPTAMPGLEPLSGNVAMSAADLLKGLREGEVGWLNSDPEDFAEVTVSERKRFGFKWFVSIASYGY